MWIVVVVGLLLGVAIGAAAMIILGAYFEETEDEDRWL